MQRIALAWWDLEETGSAAGMGTVLIFTSVPMALFLLIGGVAVDRFHRPRVMFLSDVLRSAVVAVAVLMGRLKRLRRRGVTLYLAWVVASLMIGVFGLPVSIWAMALAAFCFGGLFTVVNLIWANALQEMVKPEELGRVSSIDYLGSFGLNPFGYAFAGWATDRVGAPLVFLVGGSASAICGALGFLSKQIRDLD